MDITKSYKESNNKSDFIIKVSQLAGVSLDTVRKWIAKGKVPKTAEKLLSEADFALPFSVISLEEASKTLDLTTRKIRELCKSGAISYYTSTDGRIYFTKEDIKDYALAVRHLSDDALKVIADNHVYSKPLNPFK